MKKLGENLQLKSDYRLFRKLREKDMLKPAATKIYHPHYLNPCVKKNFILLKYVSPF